MTVDHEKHLARIKTEFCDLVDKKYRKGAVEHRGECSGELLRVPTLGLVNHAIDPDFARQVTRDCTGDFTRTGAAQR